MDVRLMTVSEDRKGELLDGAKKGESSGLSRKFDPNDPCSYSTIRKYKCFLDFGGQKCEQTQQLLRRCPGRPVEVVESETEYTQGDGPSGSLPLWGHEYHGSLPYHRFGQPDSERQDSPAGRVPKWPSHTGPEPPTQPDRNRLFGQRDFERQDFRVGRIPNSETEYTQGDRPSGSLPYRGRQPWQPWPGRTGPVPRTQPDRHLRFGQPDSERQDSPAGRVPGAFTGFGGVVDAIEDVVRETEDMAQSFLHAFGLDGDETNKSGNNPFDRWFGGGMFGGTERRSAEQPKAGSSTQSTPSQAQEFDPKDFREV